MSKYDPLREYLERLPLEPVQLTFSQVDRIVQGLPPSARRQAWWSNDRHGRHVQAAGWLDAGRRVEAVDLNAAHVTFSSPYG
ncbi:MAG TPA: hypothetical protein VK988_06475 [Acidimicrobiales bacterium]|nr:hypothetical protein [Acidimicrobiales bacterium]